MESRGNHIGDLLNEIASQLNRETLNMKIDSIAQENETLKEKWKLLSNKVPVLNMNFVGLPIEPLVGSREIWREGGWRKKVRKQTSFAKTEVISEEGSDNEMFISNNFHLLWSLPFATKFNGEKIMIQSRERHRDYPSEELEGKHSYSSQFPTEQDDFCVQKEPEVQVKMVGLLTEQERKAKVQLYLDKKKKRKKMWRVRYVCRQGLAHERFRYQGRFIKYDELYKFKNKCIIDYEGRRLLNPIFKIEKTKRRTN
jgi:hypothetical protein